MENNLRMKHIIYFLAFCLCTFACMAQNSANRLTSFDFDGFTLHILSEGQQQGNKSILLGAADSIIEKYTEKGSFPNAVNCFLVTTQNGKNILVDAGFGKLLFDNLNALNLKPEDIDCILLTHLHGDHIGGLVKDGKITFPNSQVYMSRNEFDYWKKQNNRLAQDVLEKYEKQIHLFVPNKIDEKRVTIIKEIPELSAIAAYGHTPGHTMYLFNSEKPLLIWGDLTHAMAVQMPHPEISVTYDVNPEISAESRLEVLDYVSRNRIFIAGMHIAYPAVGIIKTVVLGKSYVFVP